MRIISSKLEICFSAAIFLDFLIYVIVSRKNEQK